MGRNNELFGRSLFNEKKPLLKTNSKELSAKLIEKFSPLQVYLLKSGLAIIILSVDEYNSIHNSDKSRIVKYVKEIKIKNNSDAFGEYIFTVDINGRKAYFDLSEINNGIISELSNITAYFCGTLAGSYASTFKKLRGDYINNLD